jgi:hypothetical protein
MRKMPRQAKQRLGIAAALYALGTLVARARGYRVGWQTVVRCRSRHLFTTLWVPGVSVKSLRLGWWRLQRCHVGAHWSLVSPVENETLTGGERRFAAEHHDVRVP